MAEAKLEEVILEEQAESLDSLITQVFEKRKAASALQKEVDVLKEQQRDLEARITSSLDFQGVKLAGNETAKVAISEEQVPNVNDWEAVFKWVKENDAFYLLYKQMSAASFRELLNAGEVIPGVEAFTRRKLSIRKA